MSTLKLPENLPDNPKLQAALDKPGIVFSGYCWFFHWGFVVYLSGTTAVS